SEATPSDHGAHYTSGSRFRIGLGYVLQYAFYILFFALLFFKATFITALTGLILKICLQMIIFRKVSKQLNEPDLWGMSFFYEFILLAVYPVFHISKLLHKPNKWKS
ncbi:MAG: hypothetical protein O9353_14850, partial [Bacteroidia bacterium]|nr:hypothetical protein [Bacteroidia bacterium]